MRLPLNYAIRNLIRRKWRSLMTSFGIMIVIFASVLMIGLSMGIKERIDVAGEEKNLLLISSKGTNMMISNIEEDHLQHLVSLPNLGQSITGEPLISPEVYDICHVYHADIKNEPQPVYIRGLSSIGYEVHHSLQVIAGRLPEYEGEILVGRSLWVKMGIPEEEIAVGKILVFEKQKWEICGIFADNGSVIESEIWCDIIELQNLRRRWSPTCVFLHFKTPLDAKNTLPAFNTAGVFSRYFKAIPEKEYYRQAGGALNWIHGLSIFMSGAVALVGLLIGVNTMYTNIMNRRKEIATCQIIGFSKLDIIGTFVNESLIMTGIGTILGLYLGALADGLPLSTGQGAFFITINWQVLGIGLCLALIIAICGAIIPLYRVLKCNALENLRG